MSIFAKPFFSLIVLSFVLSGSLDAQSFTSLSAVENRIPLRTLIQLKHPEGKLKAITRAANVEMVSKQYGIYQLNYADKEVWLGDYQRLAKEPSVAAVQFDYQLKKANNRNVPNDELYEQQNNLVRMKFQEVWNEHTGGFTSDGHQIVVAILDEGFDAAHPDLVNSLWSNPGELIGDGVDNDGNGYVDDLYGWDFSRDRADVRVSMHGTQVAGIIGAKGNNGIGVSGTSWDNKLMLFAIDDVTNIIKAYEYVVDQRKLWNESNGERGALVVATNASFGLEGQSCTDFPIWGAMYDRLGEVGVLTAASTANRSWDVDERGDMPTSCTSDYIIGVTNVTEENNLERGSAWGSTSVDLAANGQGSYTTILNGNYGSFGNTSAAAPYVTGAVALLYSLPCPRITSLLTDNPPAAARLVKQAILRTVDEQESLVPLIATGGVLNMAAAADYLLDVCEATAATTLTVSKIYPNPAQGTFQFEFGDPALGPYTLSFFDAAGRLVRKDQLPAESALPISNSISVANMPRGVYFLRLSNGRQSAMSKLVLH